MRHFILAILLIVSTALQAQNFQQFKHKADSFASKSNYKMAAELYDKCIDLVLSDQEKILDFDWLDLLTQTIKVNTLNKTSAIKYMRLAYNTRAEKMTDKIALLNDMGISQVFSFSIGDWQSYITNDNLPYFCPDLFGQQMLVWTVNDNIFFQGFSPCVTYKTLKVNDKMLLDILKNHAKDLLKQKLDRKPGPHAEIVPHTFTFYLNGVATQKITADESDFLDVNEDDKVIMKNKNLDIAHSRYLANTKIYFFRLYTQCMLNCGNYFSIINSGHERAKLSELK